MRRRGGGGHNPVERIDVADNIIEFEHDAGERRHNVCHILDDYDVGECDFGHVVQLG